jgi:hypothetical protein
MPPKKRRKAGNGSSSNSGLVAATGHTSVSAAKLTELDLASIVIEVAQDPQALKQLAAFAAALSAEIERATSALEAEGAATAYPSHFFSFKNII